jgi:formamidopyrimidine-DNA glycosylase
MIELPEALIIADQLNQELKGKQIAYGNRGNVSHKFAFSSGSAEEYAAIFKDKTIGASRGHGPAILVPIEPDHVLVLGGGGERILLHESDRTLPKKHHLLLHFADGSTLTVTVQGWGNTLLLPPDQAGEHPHVALDRVTPLSEAFTWDFFQGLFDQVDQDSKASVKYFLITKPGVWGIGNGCLQDILFRAALHPRRRVVDTTAEEREALYAAIQDTLQEMVNQGGRDSERDLYNRPGGYRRLLHSKTAGQPCPACGTPIEKIQYLGGACYFCSQCQT